MLKGIDVSHHNKNMKNLADINNYDFIIIKASEGKSYKDPFCKRWMDYLTEKSLKGFYHFARPELGNSPEAEANNFLSVIVDMKKPYLLALDVEAGALNYKALDTWCLRWLEAVYKATGVKPLIYCSEAETKRFKKCCDWGAGLWIAKWSANKPKSIAPWEFFAIWQFTASGACSCVRVDEDYFNGNRDQFLRYCGVNDNEGENTDTNSGTDRRISESGKVKRASGSKRNNSKKS